MRGRRDKLFRFSDKLCGWLDDNGQVRLFVNRQPAIVNPVLVHTGEDLHVALIAARIITRRGAAR